MGRNERISTVRGDGTSSDDIRSSVAVELRELSFHEPQDIVDLLTKYAQAQVPREPGDYFLHHLVHRKDSWFVEQVDQGLMYITDAIPGLTAHLHFLYWDQKLDDSRIPAVQGFVRAAIEYFDLHRIQYTSVYRPPVKFLRKAGFQLEGTLRECFRNGSQKYIDAYVLGILSTEVNEWPQLTISSELR